MEDITKKWVERAKYDLDTAKAMFDAHRYLYVAFMCQQAIEKILKAIIIDKGKEVLRTHNLVRLAEIAEVYNLMGDETKNLFMDLTPFAIEARYGDYRDRLSEIIDRRASLDYLEKTEKIFKCLRKKIKK